MIFYLCMFISSSIPPQYEEIANKATLMASTVKILSEDKENAYMPGQYHYPGIEFYLTKRLIGRNMHGLKGFAFDRNLSAVALYGTRSKILTDSKEETVYVDADSQTLHQLKDIVHTDGRLMILSTKEVNPLDVFKKIHMFSYREEDDPPSDNEEESQGEREWGFGAGFSNSDPTGKSTVFLNCRYYWPSARQGEDPFTLKPFDNVINRFLTTRAGAFMQLSFSFDLTIDGLTDISFDGDFEARSVLGAGLQINEGEIEIGDVWLKKFFVKDTNQKDEGNKKNANQEEKDDDAWELPIKALNRKIFGYNFKFGLYGFLRLGFTDIAFKIMKTLIYDIRVDLKATRHVSYTTQKGLEMGEPVFSISLTKEQQGLDSLQDALDGFRFTFSPTLDVGARLKIEIGSIIEETNLDICIRYKMPFVFTLNSRECLFPYLFGTKDHVLEFHVDIPEIVIWEVSLMDEKNFKMTLFKKKAKPFCIFDSANSEDNVDSDSAKETYVVLPQKVTLTEGTRKDFDPLFMTTLMLYQNKYDTNPKSLGDLPGFSLPYKDLSGNYYETCNRIFVVNNANPDNFISYEGYEDDLFLNDHLEFENLYGLQSSNNNICSKEICIQTVIEKAVKVNTGVEFDTEGHKYITFDAKVDNQDSFGIITHGQGDTYIADLQGLEAFDNFAATSNDVQKYSFKSTHSMNIQFENLYFEGYMNPKYQLKFTFIRRKDFEEKVIGVQMVTMENKKFSPKFKIPFSKGHNYKDTDKIIIKVYCDAGINVDESFNIEFSEFTDVRSSFPWKFTQNSIFKSYPFSCNIVLDPSTTSILMKVPNRKDKGIIAKIYEQNRFSETDKITLQASIQKQEQYAILRFKTCLNSKDISTIGFPTLACIINLPELQPLCEGYTPLDNDDYIIPLILNKNIFKEKSAYYINIPVRKRTQYSYEKLYTIILYRVIQIDQSKNGKCDPDVTSIRTTSGSGIWSGCVYETQNGNDDSDSWSMSCKASEPKIKVNKISGKQWMIVTGRGKSSLSTYTIHYYKYYLTLDSELIRTVVPKKTVSKRLTATSDFKIRCPRCTNVRAEVGSNEYPLSKIKDYFLFTIPYASDITFVACSNDDTSTNTELSLKLSPEQCSYINYDKQGAIIDYSYKGTGNKLHAAFGNQIVCGRAGETVRYSKKWAGKVSVTKGFTPSKAKIVVSHSEDNNLPNSFGLYYQESSSDKWEIIPFSSEKYTLSPETFLHNLGLQIVEFDPKKVWIRGNTIYTHPSLHPENVNHQISQISDLPSIQLETDGSSEDPPIEPTYSDNTFCLYTSNQNLCGDTERPLDSASFASFSSYLVSTSKDITFNIVDDCVLSSFLSDLSSENNVIFKGSRSITGSILTKASIRFSNSLTISGLDVTLITDLKDPVPTISADQSTSINNFAIEISSQAEYKEVSLQFSTVITANSVGNLNSYMDYPNEYILALDTSLNLRITLTVHDQQQNTNSNTFCIYSSDKSLCNENDAVYLSEYEMYSYTNYLSETPQTITFIFVESVSISFAFTSSIGSNFDMKADTTIELSGSLDIDEQVSVTFDSHIDISQLSVSIIYNCQTGMSGMLSSSSSVKYLVVTPTNYEEIEKDLLKEIYSGPELTSFYIDSTIISLRETETLQFSLKYANGKMNCHGTLTQISQEQNSTHLDVCLYHNDRNKCSDYENIPDCYIAQYSKECFFNILEQNKDEQYTSCTINLTEDMPSRDEPDYIGGYSKIIIQGQGKISGLFKVDSTSVEFKCLTNPDFSLEIYYNFPTNSYSVVKFDTPQTTIKSTIMILDLPNYYDDPRFELTPWIGALDSQIKIDLGENKNWKLTQTLENNQLKLHGEFEGLGVEENNRICIYNTDKSLCSQRPDHSPVSIHDIQSYNYIGSKIDDTNKLFIIIAEKLTLDNFRIITPYAGEENHIFIDIDSCDPDGKLELSGSIVIGPYQSYIMKRKQDYSSLEFIMEHGDEYDLKLDIIAEEANHLPSNIIVNINSLPESEPISRQLRTIGHQEYIINDEIYNNVKITTSLQFPISYYYFSYDATISQITELGSVMQRYVTIDYQFTENYPQNICLYTRDNSKCQENEKQISIDELNSFVGLPHFISVSLTFDVTISDEILFDNITLSHGYYFRGGKIVGRVYTENNYGSVFESVDISDLDIFINGGSVRADKIPKSVNLIKHDASNSEIFSTANYGTPIKESDYSKFRIINTVYETEDSIFTYSDFIFTEYTVKIDESNKKEKIIYATLSQGDSVQKIWDQVTDIVKVVSISLSSDFDGVLNLSGIPHYINSISIEGYKNQKVTIIPSTISKIGFLRIDTCTLSFQSTENIIKLNVPFVELRSVNIDSKWKNKIDASNIEMINSNINDFYLDNGVLYTSNYSNSVIITNDGISNYQGEIVKASSNIYSIVHKTNELIINDEVGSTITVFPHPEISGADYSSIFTINIEKVHENTKIVFKNYPTLNLNLPTTKVNYSVENVSILNVPSGSISSIDVNSNTIITSSSNLKVENVFVEKSDSKVIKSFGDKYSSPITIDSFIIQENNEFTFTNLILPKEVTILTGSKAIAQLSSFDKANIILKSTTTQPPTLELVGSSFNISQLNVEFQARNSKLLSEMTEIPIISGINSYEECQNAVNNLKVKVDGLFGTGNCSTDGTQLSIILENEINASLNDTDISPDDADINPDDSNQPSKKGLSTIIIVVIVIAVVVVVVVIVIVVIIMIRKKNKDSSAPSSDSTVDNALSPESTVDKFTI